MFEINFSYRLQCFLPPNAAAMCIFLYIACSKSPPFCLLYRKSAKTYVLLGGSHDDIEFFDIWASAAHLLVFSSVTVCLNIHLAVCHIDTHIVCASPPLPYAAGTEVTIAVTLNGVNGEFFFFDNSSNSVSTPQWLSVASGDPSVDDVDPKFVTFAAVRLAFFDTQRRLSHLELSMLQAEKRLITEQTKRISHERVNQTR